MQMQDDNHTSSKHDHNLNDDHSIEQQHQHRDEQQHDQVNHIQIKQEETTAEVLDQQQQSQETDDNDPSQIDLQLANPQDVVGEDGLQLDDVVDYLQKQQELEDRRRAGLDVGQEATDAEIDPNNTNKYSNINGHTLHELGQNQTNNLHLLQTSSNHHDYSNRSSPPSVTGTATAPNSDDDNMMDFDSDDDDVDSKSNHSNSNSNLSGIDFQAGRTSASGSRKSRCSSLNGDGPSTSSGRLAMVKTTGPNGDIVIKRSHHNVLERKRRDLIKDSFTKLKDSVPSLLNERASRAQILKKAADFIQLTHERNENLRNSLNELTKKNMELATIKKVKTSDDSTKSKDIISHNENFKQNDSNNARTTTTNQQPLEQLSRANDIKLEDTKKGS